MLNKGSQELIIMAGRYCSTGTWVAQCTAEEKSRKNREKISLGAKSEQGIWNLRLTGQTAKLQKMSIQYRNGCVGMQTSQELMTMAVRHCSNAKEGGWHVALRKI